MGYVSAEEERNGRREQGDGVWMGYVGLGPAAAAAATCKQIHPYFPSICVERAATARRSLGLLSRSLTISSLCSPACCCGIATQLFQTTFPSLAGVRKWMISLEPVNSSSKKTMEEEEKKKKKKKEGRRGN
jgi:hypothetical protein